MRTSKNLMSAFAIFCITAGISNISYAKQERDICEEIKKQTLRGAEYTPGIDVHGKKVVSADISSSSHGFIKEPIIMPIEIDLIKRYNLTLPADIDLKPTVAELKIYPDGHISYNDDDITEHMTDICKSEQETENIIEQEHGQKASDPVISSDKIEGQYPIGDQDIRPHYNE